MQGIILSPEEIIEINQQLKKLIEESSDLIESNAHIRTIRLILGINTE